MNRQAERNLTPVAFGENLVRSMLGEDGNPWFVAKDKAKVLEIQNIRQSLSEPDEDEKGVCITDTLGGPQEMITISESAFIFLFSVRASRRLAPSPNGCVPKFCLRCVKREPTPFPTPGNLGAMGYKSHQFRCFSDWHIDCGLCRAGNEGKVEQVAAFLNNTEFRYLLCTHAILRFAYERGNCAAFNDVLVVIEEFHHTSAEDGNKLGAMVDALMESFTAHIIAMTVILP